jgi:tetratricopeptide (TPR) repeat protein
MIKKYAHFDAFQCDMGLGWEISTVGNKELIAKGGNVQGFSGQMVILPEGYSLILLSNLSTGAFDNFADIVEGMYGLKKVQPKMASTNFIYQQIKRQSWDKIKPRMKELEEQNGYTYNFKDYVRVAMTLKEQKDYKTATAIMEEIISNNKEYVFGYDLLGQIYELLNEKQKAIDSYRKLISLDPSIDNVALKLKTLEKDDVEKGMK